MIARAEASAPFERLFDPRRPCSILDSESRSARACTSGGKHAHLAATCPCTAKLTESDSARAEDPTVAQAPRRPRRTGFVRHGGVIMMARDGFSSIGALRLWQDFAGPVFFEHDCHFPP